MLRCKKDDIAQIVKGTDKSDNIGKIVTCLKFIGNPPDEYSHLFPFPDLWEVDQDIVWASQSGWRPPTICRLIPDSYLRPFPKSNDKDVDEMVKLKGPVPEVKIKELVK